MLDVWPHDAFKVERRVPETLQKTQIDPGLEDVGVVRILVGSDK